MRSTLFFLSFLSLSFVFASPALDSARQLAEDGIIVDQSSLAQKYRVNSSLEVQESNMYRLYDTLLRQEALSIALNLRGIEIPSNYICRGYFSDLPEEWVCRVVEFSADYDIVTRSNKKFRPHDSLTLAESLKILMVSLQIPLTDSDARGISGNIPDWQKRIILTLREKNIYFSLYGDYDNQVVSFSYSGIYDPVSVNMSHRMTRGEFFQLVTALLNYQNSSDPLAHCTVYNDGCNDCSVLDGVGGVCTKRACFWKGIPSCSACEIGYSLKDNRCVKTSNTCVKEGGYAGGGYVMYPENPANFQCCAGLTRAERKDGNTLADAGYTCIRQGDGVCNSMYESEYNSSDCKNIAFDQSICLNYYDGCNSCSKDSNGQTACTMRYCSVIAEPSYCQTYVPYSPINQTQDNTFLSKVLSEIQNYTKDVSCSSSSQCQWKMFGSTPCGGSSIAVKYSTQNVNETLLTSKTWFYTDAQRLYNQTYSVFGTCVVMTSPAPLSCINSQCVSSY